MTTDEQQIAALVDEIRRSSVLAGAPKLRELFDYLYERRSDFTSGEVLAWELFKINRKNFYAQAGKMRVRCRELREALAKYQVAPGAQWRCSFPDAVRGKGYKLEFERIVREDAATRLFWQPHLEFPQCVIVITNTHLFFYDAPQGLMFRFGDVNVEGRQDEALSELKRLHPDADKSGLQRNYFYLSAGEVSAFEMLQRWLHERTGVLIPRYVSRDVLDGHSHNSSPVLLGRPGANRFIQRIIESPEAAHLGYRFRDPLGGVHIDVPREAELKALSRFPLSDRNVLGPVRDWQVIFAIVTRLPNPSGHGTVTIISADYYPRAIAQVVALLLDAPRTGKLIEQMGLKPNSPLPPSFEMLFAVRLSPGNLEGEGHAEFLCGRSYPG